MTEKIVYRDFKNGFLNVRQVPYNQYSRGYGADGEKEYIDGAVLYRLSYIFKNMLSKGHTEAIYSEEGTYVNVIECSACGGGGFHGYGTGYDSMCDNCAGMGEVARYNQEELE